MPLPSVCSSRQLQVVQVVAGNHDERSFFHRQRHGGRLGRAVASRCWPCPAAPCTVRFFSPTSSTRGSRSSVSQSSPTANSALAKKRLTSSSRIAQHHRVVGVGRHAAHTEQDERLETADVLVRTSRAAQCRSRRCRPQRRHAGRRSPAQAALFSACHACESASRMAASSKFTLVSCGETAPR